MMKKNIKFEVVSHDKAVELAQKNASKRFKLQHEQLPTVELKSARRVLKTIPVTNKMYQKLQEQIKRVKDKEKQKKLEQIAIHQQQQANKDDEFEL